MMYAFAKPEAVRSFREAWKRDPDCAICYWGEAWAWGSYLNAPMNAEEAPHAYAAAQKALSLQEPAPRRRSARSSTRWRCATSRSSTRPSGSSRIARMPSAMQKVVGAVSRRSRHRHALRRRAVPARAAPRHARRQRSRTSSGCIRCSKRILAQDVHHPGACHLYVHATESTVVPGRAEACAEFLGRSIPGASHINHMPSHTWNEVGRWGDSVRANLEAWHSDQKAAIGEGFAIYPEHNLHMLLYAASYDGQGAIAMRAGKDYAKLTGESFYEVLTLIRFGRFDEVLAGDEPAEDRRSRAASGTSRRATRTSSRATPTSRSSIWRASRRRPRRRRPRSASTRRRTCSASRPASWRARFSGRRANLDGAIASFQRAASPQEALVYDEPEPLPFSAFHWLGAALLEAKRFDEAEQAYRDELKDHPHNGWSLLGLQQALEGKGKGRPTWTPTWRRAGPARTPGSGRRASERAFRLCLPKPVRIILTPRRGRLRLRDDNENGCRERRDVLRIIQRTHSSSRERLRRMR